MFLRCSKRKKDGKEHRYWSIVDVPTTDGRQVILSRYTQPEPDLQLLLQRLKLQLPMQPKLKITASGQISK